MDYALVWSSCPVVPCSALMSRFQLLRGRGLSSSYLRVPGQGLSCGVWNLFSRVCPIQSLFLRTIFWATGSCPARFHRSSGFFYPSSHLMLKIRLGQVMINVWILWCIIFVVHHALHLLSRRELTFELKIRSLPFECLDVLQWNKTFFITKVCLLVWDLRVDTPLILSYKTLIRDLRATTGCRWQACQFTGIFPPAS